jgi:hypothetical protein
VELGREPPLAPRAELADDRRELQTGRRQSVLGSAVASVALDHPNVGQLADARREHGARDAREPALDLPEAATPAQKLAYDEERPSLPEQIGGRRIRPPAGADHRAFTGVTFSMGRSRLGRPTEWGQPFLDGGRLRDGQASAS